ncbi:MAG TPA: zinc dependent phospholipase C family protein [Longimicrobiales bacterium]|nr:zinc dependent phospholipase C family protein [Longimicrobiales bacterium]
MPQPALHLLLARQTLDRWRSGTGAPFDLDSDLAVNAFLHGSLGPDMGNFPGGSTPLARLVHRRRTGDVQRALLAGAQSDAGRAYALGWLSHIIADVLIHPLVNEVAATLTPGAGYTISEHVRVEVGLDVWFCCDQPSLEGLRLRPAFDRTGYAPLASALNDVAGAGVVPAQLVQMERGLMMFSHAALHFARSVARQLCWREDVAVRTPLGSAIVWHLTTALSPRASVIHAYLNPLVPGPSLVGRVQDALAKFQPEYDAAVADGAQSLPNYNLEDGTITTEDDLRAA